MWVERGVRQSRMARRINGKGDYPVAKKATLARAVLKAFGDEDCLSWHDLGLRLEDDRALKFAFSVTRFSPIPFLVRTVDGDGIVHCCRTREMHSPNEPAPRSGFYQHRRRRYQDAHTDQTGQVRLIFGSSPAYRPLVRETLLPFGMPKTNQLCGIFVIRGALQDHAHSIYGTAFEPDPSNFTPPQMLIAPGMPIKPWNRIKKRYANTNERIRNPIDPDEISGIDEWDHDYEMPDKR